MNNIFSYYTKYRENIPEYNKRVKGNQKNNISAISSFAPLQDDSKLKQKAGIITNPILLADSYEHEKAEDAETFFQTLNIELMSVAGIITSLPVAVTKIMPFLKKHAKDGNFTQKVFNALKNYKEKTVRIASKNIPLPKALTAVSAVFGIAFFASGIKKSMESQLGLIRKSSFDATQSIINDPKLFAVLTPEQQQKIDAEISYENKNKSAFVNALHDKINLSSTFSSVEEYRATLDAYKKQKEEYFRSIETKRANPASGAEIQSAKEDQLLFNSLLNNVEHAVLEPLRRVETISNISYSSLFTGGFLEYLITDKLVQALGVKNKIIASAIKFGAPLITYLLLNKNISDIENKAILATKYKYLKQFAENPMQYASEQHSEKQSLPEFLKTVYHDMKEYDKFAKEDLPKIKQRLELQRTVTLSPAQEKEAKRLQKNTAMVINKHREEVYNQTVGIKAFSESILGPIDIIATAFGALIGGKMAKKAANPKYTRLFTGLGAAISFIPAAIIEAQLTKQQKLAEKIAAMKTIDSIQNENLFLGETVKYLNMNIIQNNPEIFKDFLK